MRAQSIDDWLPLLGPVNGRKQIRQVTGAWHDLKNFQHLLRSAFTSSSESNVRNRELNTAVTCQWIMALSPRPRCPSILVLFFFLTTASNCCLRLWVTAFTYHPLAVGPPNPSSLRRAPCQWAVQHTRSCVRCLLILNPLVVSRLAQSNTSRLCTFILKLFFFYTRTLRSGLL